MVRQGTILKVCRCILYWRCGFLKFHVNTLVLTTPH